MPRKSLVTAMRRDIVAAVAKERRELQRHCTGDPNTCRYSYDVAASPEIPLCGIMGGECDRGHTRDRALRGPR